jgi:hypothetical protein
MYAAGESVLLTLLELGVMGNPVQLAVNVPAAYAVQGLADQPRQDAVQMTSAMMATLVPTIPALPVPTRGPVSIQLI